MKYPVKITQKAYDELAEVRIQWETMKLNRNICMDLVTEVLPAAREAGFDLFAQWVEENEDAYRNVQALGWEIVPPIEQELLKIFGTDNIKEAYKAVAGHALLEYVQTVFPAVNAFTNINSWRIHPDKNIRQKLQKMGVQTTLTVITAPPPTESEKSPSKMETTELELHNLHFGIGSRHFHRIMAYHPALDVLWYRDDIDPEWVTPPAFDDDIQIIKPNRKGDNEYIN